MCTHCVLVVAVCVCVCVVLFFFQAEDGIRDLVRSRGLGDVYKRQVGGLCSKEPLSLRLQRAPKQAVQLNDLEIAARYGACPANEEMLHPRPLSFEFESSVNVPYLARNITCCLL
mgnify:CR=1 FL=1